MVVVEGRDLAEGCAGDCCAGGGGGGGALGGLGGVAEHGGGGGVVGWWSRLVWLVWLVYLVGSTQDSRVILMNVRKSVNLDEQGLINTPPSPLRRIQAQKNTS